MRGYYHVLEENTAGTVKLAFTDWVPAGEYHLEGIFAERVTTESGSSSERNRWTDSGVRTTNRLRRLACALVASFGQQAQNQRSTNTSNDVARASKADCAGSGVKFVPSGSVTAPAAAAPR